MDNIFLIVGLGNPGKEYDKTRHNIGFEIIDDYANEKKITINENKFNGLFSKFSNNGKTFIIAKPQTYMNLSGKFISEIVKFYKIDVENILVIYDDKDMELGKIRLRPKGSSGGHNGIKSIIESLGTENFKRLKIGIGSPKNKSEMINFVIGKFRKEEWDSLIDSISISKKIIDDFSKIDFNSLMNKYN